MKGKKARLATVATIIGLGGLTGIALSSGGQKAGTLAAKPLVQTKVIHRTVRVTKHVKPKGPVAAGGTGYASGSGGGEAAPVVTSSSGTGGEAAPVTTATSGTGGEAAPVTTATSGTGGAASGGEVDHESGDGDDD